MEKSEDFQKIIDDLYGGSRNNPRNCEPRDFKYLIDGQVIDVV